MKATGVLTALFAAALIDTTVAHPGMGKVVDEIRTMIEARQTNATTSSDSDGRNPSLDSNDLIGDLATLPDSQLTAVGRDVKATILGQADGQSLAAYTTPVPQLGTAACAADTCCVWKYISDAMAAAFRGPSGRCTNLARGAVRLGFHDAAGFSKATAPLGGGADGSIVLAPQEMTRRDNRGLEEIVAQMKVWYARFRAAPGGGGVSMADLIQMGATVAAVTCPLGPRVKTYVGRADSARPAPDGLLPSVTASSAELMELFQNKTIAPNGLVALLGAHTTSQQRFVDPARAGDPQDSTPGVWDVAYYRQTLDPNAPPRVFKFPSDINVATDPRVHDLFVSFGDQGDGQEDWNEVSENRAFPGLFLSLSLAFTHVLISPTPTGLRSRVRPPQPPGREQHQQPHRLHQGAAPARHLLQRKGQMPGPAVGQHQQVGTSGRAGHDGGPAYQQPLDPPGTQALRRLQRAGSLLALYRCLDFTSVYFTSEP